MTTLWILALAAFGFVAFRMRRRMQSSTGKKRLEGERRTAAAQLREQDRLDCLELEQSLKTRLTSDRADAALAPPARRP